MTTAAIESTPSNEHEAAEIERASATALAFVRRFIWALR
jgi:hypothetical protein